MSRCGVTRGRGRRCWVGRIDTENSPPSLVCAFGSLFSPKGKIRSTHTKFKTAKSIWRKFCGSGSSNNNKQQQQPNNCCSQHSSQLLAHIIDESSIREHWCNDQQTVGLLSLGRNGCASAFRNPGQLTQGPQPSAAQEVKTMSPGHCCKWKQAERNGVAACFLSPE